MLGQTNHPIREKKLQRALRNNMTDAERRLWQQLRGGQMVGWKFRRQHPFSDFILDFVCLEAKLVIEVDGGQHAEMQDGDLERTGYLEAAGFRVIRFWNHEILQEIDVVKEKILQVMMELTPSPP